MKWAAIIIIVLVVGLFGLVYLDYHSIWQARIAYSRFELRRGLQDLQETGGLRNHTNLFSVEIPRPFLFTNTVTVRGTNYRCALAYDDPTIHHLGFLAVTTNGVFIYFDKKRGPRLIPSE
jgi:hypothetical protein